MHLHTQTGNIDVPSILAESSSKECERARIQCESERESEIERESKNR